HRTTRIALLPAALSLIATTAGAAPLKVVTTIQDLASLTKEVGGDRVDVTAIARGYQDPHFVEPKPSFLLLLRNAELLERVGLELEIGWLPPLLDQSRNPNIRPGTKGYLDVSHGVEILDRPTVVNRSMGDVHPLGNPHYWLDPANAVRIAIQIERKLAELRPADAPYFAKRLNELKLRMNVPYKSRQTAIATYRGAQVVTYPNAWHTFTRGFCPSIVW